MLDAPPGLSLPPWHQGPAGQQTTYGPAVPGMGKGSSGRPPHSGVIGGASTAQGPAGQTAYGSAVPWMGVNGGAAAAQGPAGQQTKGRGGGGRGVIGGAAAAQGPAGQTAYSSAVPGIGVNGGAAAAQAEVTHKAPTSSYSIGEVETTRSWTTVSALSSGSTGPAAAQAEVVHKAPTSSYSIGEVETTRSWTTASALSNCFSGSTGPAAAQAQANLATLADWDLVLARERARAWLRSLDTEFQRRSAHRSVAPLLAPDFPPGLPIGSKDCPSRGRFAESRLEELDQI